MWRHEKAKENGFEFLRGSKLWEGKYVGETKGS